MKPAKTLSTIFTLIVALMIPVMPSARAADTSTRWDSFSESTECGAPFTRGPYASKMGYLSDSEAILGPFGAYFGRSISQIRSNLRYWTVPYSGGLRVRVHKAMLPSLQKVASALVAHTKEGRVYRISAAAAFVPRTIGGRYRISRHALGLAIDINPAQNPFRQDNVLITNMPGWFVETWQDAGFCWGGDWSGSKDPMHFAWMGPGSTPWESDSISPLPPTTLEASFGAPVDDFATEFSPVMSRYVFGLVDANSNGTADVVGLRSHPTGAVMDIALSSLGFGYCSIGRWYIPDDSVDDADHVVFADVDGDSGVDLVALSANGASLRATVATRQEGYDDPSTSVTGLSSDAVAVVGADFDGDHIADLWEATPSGRLRIWRGPEFTGLMDDSLLPDGAPLRLAAGDRDGGDRPELYALYRAGTDSRIDVLTYDGSWAEDTSIMLDTDAESVEAIGAGDYDGDGRADAQVFTSQGTLVEYVGNTSTGVPATRWFMQPDPHCHSRVLLDYNGSFMDDEDSIFEDNIESIAAVGVTKGCNPPFNDRFCPGSSVSREQMAAFLVRALGLTEDDHVGFVDVPSDGTFATDISRLATAGITKGCNPPDNDRFCPKDSVTREQMAAFVVRSLGLTDTSHEGFTDVPSGGTFYLDIRKLAGAGITKGCNPPANDRFCPDDPVTREQMAAFLDRAGLGS